MNFRQKGNAGITSAGRKDGSFVGELRDTPQRHYRYCVSLRARPLAVNAAHARASIKVRRLSHARRIHSYICWRAHARSINVIISGREFLPSFLPSAETTAGCRKKFTAKGELIRSNNSARLNRRRLNAV